MPDTSRQPRPKERALRAWLQLVRLPAVFTAMADVALGYLMLHGRPHPAGDWLPFALLITASSCLYLAGMAFNDVFDRRIDAVERPQRPIPSGRVSLKAAVLLGGVLVVSGVTAAAFVGRQSLWIACGLVAAIFAYDGALKATPAGPLVMGGCRFLNVMLGASAASTAAEVWQSPHWLVAGALGVYVTGLTWFARGEAGTSRRRSLILGSIVVNLGLAGLAALALFYPWPRIELRHRHVVFLLLAVTALTINRRLTAAVIDPIPHKVQPAVRTLILSVVMLDAAMILVATGVPPYAIATVALLAPAILLGRWLYVT
ncbi:MAG: UbiA family prenyltransferase [Planctomycetes bacterium]|nr:UbiA family prenyltransferase [Planctomycetota bacterium]